MLSSPVSITVGIAANNEEQALSCALRSIFEQQLPHGWSVDLVVVANGCTDRTVETAIQVGEQKFGPPVQTIAGQLTWWRFCRQPMSYAVCATPVAGKSNALNLIHASCRSQLVLRFDADVRVGKRVVCRLYLPEEGRRSVQVPDEPSASSTAIHSLRAKRT